MVQYGRHLDVARTRLTTDTLSPGVLYEVDVEVAEAITNPAEVADFVISKINAERPEMQVSWIQVSRSGITIQFTVTPAKTLSVSSLSPWLSTILVLVGLTVAFIAIFELMSSIPGWVWALLIIGGILVFFGPQLGKIVPQPR